MALGVGNFANRERISVSSLFQSQRSSECADPSLAGLLLDRDPPSSRVGDRPECALEGRSAGWIPDGTFARRFDGDGLYIPSRVGD